MPRALLLIYLRAEKQALLICSARMKKTSALKLVTHIRHTCQPLSRSFPLTGLRSFSPSNVGTCWNSLAEESLELIRLVLGINARLGFSGYPNFRLPWLLRKQSFRNR
jgi:hypothetical protein